MRIHQHFVHVLRPFTLLGLIAVLTTGWDVGRAHAQDNGPADPVSGSPQPGFSSEELEQLSGRSAAAPDPDGPMSSPTELGQGSINFLNLLVQGGTLMVPIAVMSLLVVAVALERMFALRSGRVFPRGLRRELRRTVEDTGVAAPQVLYEASQRYRSVAARILEDVLQKVGRPVPEIEQAINEGTEREADYLYGNVRWLTLAAAVTPLIGLLGTVWGMIIAFYNTTKLGTGGNKAEFLAEGIYVALVTTLGGLAVAIPAAIFAHFFEGRITHMLSAIETELRRLVPRFEALEGKARYDINSRGLTRRMVSENTARRRVPEPAGKPPAVPSSTAKA